MPAILDKISWDSNYVVFLIICDFRVPSKQQCYLLKFGKNSLYKRPSLFAGWREEFCMCEKKTALQMQICPWLYPSADKLVLGELAEKRDAQIWIVIFFCFRWNHGSLHTKGYLYHPWIRLWKKLREMEEAGKIKLLKKEKIIKYADDRANEYTVPSGYILVHQIVKHDEWWNKWWKVQR